MDKTEEAPATAAVEIPVTVFRYVEFPPHIIRDAKRPYRLESIVYGRRVVHWETRAIERTTLIGSDLLQLQLFNDVFIEEANAESLSLELISHTGIKHTLARPQHRGPEEVVRIVRPSARIEESDLDTFYATSLYTLIHDYVETRSGFFHLGIMTMPCRPLFVPLWIGEPDARQLFSTTSWAHRLAFSKGEALIAMRRPPRTVTLQHVQLRSVSKHHNMETVHTISA